MLLPVCRLPRVCAQRPPSAQHLCCQLRSCALVLRPRTRHPSRRARAEGSASQASSDLAAELSAAKSRIAQQEAEIERLGAELAAAFDNVTAARAAAATLDAQRAAAVTSVSRALAEKRDLAMAHADARDAWEAQLAELQAQLAQLQAQLEAGTKRA